MSEIGVKVSKSRTDIFVSNKNNNKSSEEENDISMNSDVIVGTIIKDVDHDDLQKTVVQQPDCTTESTCMVNGVVGGGGVGTTTTDDNNSNVCHSSCNEWIKLNVGGTYFQTTRTTLCSDRNSFFYRLLQDDSLNSEKDENGAYLIDRDPSYFAPILNFLRHGKLIINKDLNEDGVREEAEFYNVTSLIKMLDKHQTDHLNRVNDSSKNNHVYRLLHCCEGELSLAISTLSDGWKFEQLVPNFPNWTTDYFVVVSREYPIKR